MLGWEFTVWRQSDGGVTPATAHSPNGTLLASWQAGPGGLDWLDGLVKEGKAINLGGNDYPSLYTATAEYLFPRIVDMPPGEKSDWEGWKVVWSPAPGGRTMPSRRVADR